MRNFIANFVRILGICKDFVGKRANKLENVSRDEWGQTAKLAEEVRKGVAVSTTDNEDVFSIDSRPVKACRMQELNIEPIFPQLNDHHIMIRNCTYIILQPHVKS